ncbi:MAG: hypothetical protein HQ464_14295 [Planctomycetes bacterium]|nr:hypothetical protein [Planctomycetota bacterium]
MLLLASPSFLSRLPAPPRPAGVWRVVAAIVAVCATPTILPAAELSPQMIAGFTKYVQPLILNKCGAGACHGGPTSHAPHFQRGDVSGRLDRGLTLTNIRVLTNAIGKSGNPAALIATISSRHPASAGAADLSLTPLTTQERARLELWLNTAVVRSEPEPPRPIAANADASQGTAAALRPTNRFRAMLDAAANPQALPPPTEPQGIFLGKDRD